MSHPDDTPQWRGGPARTTSSFKQAHWRVKRPPSVPYTADTTCTINDKPVELISNCFRIKFGLTMRQIMYQYKIFFNYSTSTGDLDEDSVPTHVKRMSSDKMPRELRRQLAKLALDKCIDPPKEDWLYRLDQSCFTVLYTNFDLLSECDLKVRDCHVELPYVHGAKRQTLTYQVKFTKMRFDDPRKALNVILSTQDEEVIVYQTAAQTTEFSAIQQRESISITPNIRLVHGTSMNFKPFAVGSTLSISHTSGLFYEPIGSPRMLTTILQEDFDVADLSKELSSETVDKLKALLINRHIEITYCRYGKTYRKFKVHDVISSAYDSFNLTKFDTEVSIVDHYKSKYDIDLKYPALPCIATDRSSRTMLPLELCQLCPGEKAPDQLTAEDECNLNRKSDKKPEEFFKEIEYFVERAFDACENDLKKIDISIERQPIRMMGTVVSPVWLAGLHRDMPIVPYFGRYDASRAMFLRPIKMNGFCITLIGTEETFESRLAELQPEVLSKFIKEYCQVGQSKGIKIDVEQALVEIIVDEKEDALKEKLRRHVEQLNQLSVDHSVMVLPPNCTWIYAYLQFLETCFQFSGDTSGRRTRLSCLRFGTLSQILQERDLKNQIFYQSLWSKYNAKLGGINYTLKSNGSFDLPDSELLILGVCIGQKSFKLDKQSYSIASMVGMCSVDSEDYSCYTRMRAQRTFVELGRAPVEQVINIDTMLSSILDSYARDHGAKYPSKILILRDGVSAVQFNLVEDIELEKIMSMCKRRYEEVGQNEPSITCVIIQRRHDIRFKLATPAVVRDREIYNMTPGTIVDADAIRPERFLFYSAQAPGISNYNMARPVFACKVINGIRYTARQVQRLILALCYLSPRSTDSTHMPAPLDFAEQASERGKNIALGWFELNPPDTNFDSERNADQLDSLNSYFCKLGNAAYLDTLFYI